MGSQRVGHDWATFFHFSLSYWYIKQKMNFRVIPPKEPTAWIKRLECSEFLILIEKKPTKNATQLPEIEYFSVFCPDMAKKSVCYALNVCLSPKIICWNPKSHMVVLLGVASGKCLSHNDGALMNGFMVPRSLLFQPPACMLSLESYPTSCDPMDFSPPGFSVHGFSRQEYWSGLPCPTPGDLEPKSHVFCIGRWVPYHWCHLGSLQPPELWTINFCCLYKLPSLCYDVIAAWKE